MNRPFDGKPNLILNCTLNCTQSPLYWISLWISIWVSLWMAPCKCSSRKWKAIFHGEADEIWCSTWTPNWRPISRRSTKCGVPKLIVDTANRCKCWISTWIFGTSAFESSECSKYSLPGFGGFVRHSCTSHTTEELSNSLKISRSKILEQSTKRSGEWGTIENACNRTTWEPNLIRLSKVSNKLLLAAELWRALRRCQQVRGMKRMIGRWRAVVSNGVRWREYDEESTMK